MTEAVALAKQYFDLSNQRKLAEIEKLFTASSTYSSANTGMYLGAEQIMQMQSAFFAGYTSLNWVVNHVVEEKPGIVLLDFTFTGTTINGETVTRDGLEYVIVYNGNIQHIDVRNKA